MTLEEKIKNKLYEGQIIKNETELYRLLDLIPSDNKTIKGNERKKIKNTIQAFINYERVDNSNSIRILEIFEDPFPIIDKRKEGIYVTYIETLLLSHLFNESPEPLYITYKGLFDLLGMINNNYYNTDNRVKLQKIDKRITKFEATNFFLRSYSLMRRIIDRALKSLMDRSKIWVEKNIIIEGDFYNEYMEKQEKHIATKEEISIILDIETEVLNKLNIQSKNQVFWRGKSADFYEEVKYILKEKYGWWDYYKEFYIIPGQKMNLKKAIEENLIELNRSTLNKNIINSVNKDADNKYKLQEKEYKKEWELYKETKECSYNIGLCNDYDTFVKMIQSKTSHYPDNYLEIQELLSKYFLSIVPEDQQALIDYIENNKDKLKDIQEKITEIPD